MAIDLDVHLPAIAAGDTEAFGMWMAAAEVVLRRSLRGAASRVDVEAVLQETLLRIWQIAPRIAMDGRPNAVLRLALVTARNLVVTEIRRARVDPVPDDALERMLAEAAVDPGASDPLLRAAIRKCHEGLPAKPMQALRARLTAGGAEPDRMLAARLDMSLNTFLQNLTRARRLLLECLERHGIAAHEVTG